MGVNELQHHGILGMRWGIRRSRGSDGRVASQEHRQTRELKRKSVSEMSNAELRQLNERMQLEKTYRQLNPSTVSSGRAVGGKILKSIGNKVVERVIDKGITMALDKVFKK